MSPRSPTCSAGPPWPAGLQWIVRRTKPSRLAGQEADRLRARRRPTVFHHRHQHPGTGIMDVPDSHHPSSSMCCTASTPSSKTGYVAKSINLHNLPSKTWLVNCGWVLAAWCRLLGLYDCDDLKEAEPDTLRYRLWSLPAGLVRPAQRTLKLSLT